MEIDCITDITLTGSQTEIEVMIKRFVAHNGIQLCDNLWLIEGQLVELITKEPESEKRDKSRMLR